MDLPSPQEVCAEFSALRANDPEQALAYLHGLGVSSGYLQVEAGGTGAASKAIWWTGASPFGNLECTINVAKPEKDPRDIARAYAASSDAPSAVPDATAGAVPSAVPDSVSGTAPGAASDATAGAVSSAASDATAGAVSSAAPGATAGAVSSAAPGATAYCSLSQTATPQCDICWENEEFPGTPEHPAKPGLRIAAILLGNERWGLQYSPYAYFPEHCIVLSKEHRPMKIDESCFERLLDFVECFPGYFIGANADLPIVGGSILSHDHFQGGRYEFPLMRAPLVRAVTLNGLGEVQCGIVKWPASVLRLSSAQRSALLEAASRILRAWRVYSNEACDIAAFTSAQHNTLNPIARKTESGYVLDLVLRNNRSSQQHPWGIFHPAQPLHHLKKENIGLIEIMGLAVLPPRLATELPLVQGQLILAAREGLAAPQLEALLSAHPATAAHAAWATDIYMRRAADLALVDACAPQQLAKAPATTTPIILASTTQAATTQVPITQANELHPVIRQEVAAVFASILKATGVFKHTPVGAAGWDSFICKLGALAPASRTDPKQSKAAHSTE